MGPRQCSFITFIHVTKPCHVARWSAKKGHQVYSRNMHIMQANGLRIGCDMHIMQISYLRINLHILFL